MSIADIFTVVIALLALLVNVVFVTFQITWRQSGRARCSTFSAN